MIKQSLIFKYFQHKDRLTIKNKDYCQSLSSLFLWLKECDKADNDRTSQLLHLTSTQKAKIISHGEGILAGMEEISFLLSKNTSLLFNPLIKDGEKLKREQMVAEIEGNASEILAFERTILNIIQRLSGIATETYKLNQELRIMNQGLFLAATRKTPWMLLDKKAVAVGGGLTHRLNLADGILIKDNHLIALKNEYKLKSIEEAIERALELSFERLNPAKRGSTSTDLIEIEVKTPNQAQTAIETFNKINTTNHLATMFDNFSPVRIKNTTEELVRSFELSSIIFEASGGIDENNIKDYAKTGVDLLSLGSLTHSPQAANFSLEI